MLRRAVPITIVAAAVTVAMASCSSSSQASSVPENPHFSLPLYGRAATLTGPVTVGHLIDPESSPGVAVPSADGYTDQEFFASGTASAFAATSEPSNGRWAVTPTTSAAYRTRILVRRPTESRAVQRHGGGRVAQRVRRGVGSGLGLPQPGLTDAGFAYVGVSAQALGVDGGAVGILGGSPAGLVQQRAGPVRHPAPPGRPVRPGHLRPGRAGLRRRRIRPSSAA